MLYADWLAEAGQPAVAENIRLECALYRLPKTDPRFHFLQQRHERIYPEVERYWNQLLGGLTIDWVLERGVVHFVTVDPIQFAVATDRILSWTPARVFRLHHFTEHLENYVRSPNLGKVKELDLVNAGVEPEQLRVMGKSNHLQQLEGLSLGFNRLGALGLTALARSHCFGQLKRLALNECRLASDDAQTTQAMRLFAEASSTQTLESLDLSGNSLTAAQLQPLLHPDALGQLAQADFSDNPLGDDGLQQLVRSPLFRRLCQRGVLKFMNMRLSAPGAALIANCPHVQSIEELSLDENRISDPGLGAIAQSPHFRRLRKLSLRSTSITDYGIRQLARAPLLATLAELNLGGNIISPSAITRLQNGAATFADSPGLLITRDG